MLNRTLHVIVPSILLLAAAAGAQQKALDPEMFAKQELSRYARSLAIAEAERSKAETAGQTDYDVLHYTLDLDIDPSAETVGGTVTIRLTPLVSILDSMVVDLHDSMLVSVVKRDTSVLSYSHTGDLLTIQLDRGFTFGETLSVSITYSGRPQNLGFSSFTFGTHGNGEVAIYSLSEPYYARTWWPCKDVPNDKATAEIFITVPDTLIVASNGTLAGIDPLGGGKHRYRWAENYPISTYLVSVAISNYETFSHYYKYAPAESMEVVYFVYPEDLGAAQIDFDVTVDMITFFSNKFCQYPFIDEKYGMAEFGWGGGMEHQTCTSYGDVLITGDHSYDWINAHELSHQWWGDKITLYDWPDIWLNEGFATYSEALWVEYISGFSAYQDRMRARDKTSGFAGPVYDPVDLFGVTVYWKGSWVLHMLRHVMGDSSFFDALRDYATDPALAYGNATTADFQAICENRYGSDLSWFFGEWVYGEGRPSYEYSWTQYRSGDDHVVSLTIEQVQTGAFFEMPIDIRLTLPSGDTTFVVWNRGNPDYFNFFLPESVLALAFDPEDWILKYVNEVPTATAAVPYASGLAIYNVPNPFSSRTSIFYETRAADPGEILIFDVKGRVIRKMAAPVAPGGRGEVYWDARDDRGQPVASGIYILKLRTPYGAVTRKMMLVK